MKKKTSKEKDESLDLADPLCYQYVEYQLVDAIRSNWQIMLDSMGLDGWDLDHVEKVERTKELEPLYTFIFSRPAVAEMDER